MVKILIKATAKQRVLSNSALRRIIKKTLDSQGIRRGELSLLIAGDSQIEKLNRRFLGRKWPTDVLAFNMREGKRLENAGHILGDVVVSLDRARAQAEEFGTSLKKELALYVIHGILHLAGHKDGSKKMEKLQQKILKGFFR